MNAKKIRAIGNICVFILSAILIFSCNKENPLQNNQNIVEFDSARFNWTRYYYEGRDFYYNLWVADTNNVFAVDDLHNTVLKLNKDNNTFYSFSGNELASVIVGSDLNNCFLLGSDVTEGNYKFIIWKYLGDNFVKIQEFAIDVPTKLRCAFYESPSDIWVAGWNGFVARYDGVDIFEYQLSDSLIFLDIFRDKQNKLKLFAFSEDFLHMYCLINHIYEYNPELNNWTYLFRDTVGTSDYGYGLVVLDKEIIGVGNNPGEISIHSFDGLHFRKIIDFGKIANSINMIDGLSLSNFVISGAFTFGTAHTGLSHWNGINLSKEEVPYTSSFSKIKYYNENFCAFTRQCVHNGNGTEIFIGKRK